MLNATNFRLHYELSRIWLDLGEDRQVRVAVITGAGNAFSAGGDFEMIEKAIGWTKRALNQWLRMAGHAAFEFPLAAEMLGFFGPDVGEGLKSMREKRPPSFPPAR